MLGGDDLDYLHGNDGADSIAGGVGKDTIIGGEGNDELAGKWLFEFGDEPEEEDVGDVVVGGANNDTLYGGEGNDSLFGGTGADLLLANDDGSPISGNMVLLGGQARIFSTADG